VKLWVRFIERMVARGAGALLAAVAIFTAVAGWLARPDEIDLGRASLLSQGDPDVARSREIEPRFGPSAQIAIVCELGHPFTTADLRDLARLADALAALPGVARVLALTNAVDLRGHDGALERAVLVDRENANGEAATSLEENWERVIGHRWYERWLVAPALDAVALRLWVAGAATPARVSETLSAVQRVLAELAPRWPVHVSAPRAAAVIAAEIAREDIVRLGPAVALSFVLGLAVLARSAQAALAVALSIAFCEAALFTWLALTHTPLTRVTALAPLLLFGLAAWVLGPACLRERPAGSGGALDAGEIAQRCAGSLAAAIALAVAWLALSANRVPAVAALGAALGVGSLALAACALVVLPAWFARFGVPVAPRGRTGVNAGPTAWGLRLARAPLVPIATAAVLAAALFPGISALQFDTDLASQLRSGHPLAGVTRSGSREIAGARSLDVSIDARESGGALDPETLQFTAALRDLALAEGCCARSSTALDELWLIDAQLRAGANASEVPASRERAALDWRLFADAVPGTPVHAAFAADQSQLLLRLWLANDSSESLLALVDRLARRAASATRAPQVSFAGDAYLEARSARAVTLGSLSGITAMAAAAVLVLALALRSLWLALAAMLPPLFALAAIASVLGQLGIPLDADLALLGCAALAIALADSAGVFTASRAAVATAAEWSAEAGATRRAGIAVALATAPLALAYFAPLAHFAAVVLAALAISRLVGVALAPSLLALAGRRIGADATGPIGSGSPS
jgi:predicted RND superfamily exporter protein